ncbi:hypothetical protein DXG01_016207 [Tephrocybe rancida]|nr:hypothetical protein DXG01_016207 [Tephrocybe rancida]
MQKLGKALRATRHYAKSYSDTQITVLDATSNDPLGPSGTQMHEIAQLTYNSNDFLEVVDILDRRLGDNAKNWRHILKSLTVIDYILHQGSENTIIYYRDHIDIITILKNFQYIDDGGKDVGARIRRKATETTELIVDEHRIREERRRPHMVHIWSDDEVDHGEEFDTVEGGRGPKISLLLPARSSSRIGDPSRTSESTPLPPPTTLPSLYAPQQQVENSSTHTFPQLLPEEADLQQHEQVTQRRNPDPFPSWSAEDLQKLNKALDEHPGEERCMDLEPPIRPDEEEGEEEEEEENTPPSDFQKFVASLAEKNWHAAQKEEENTPPSDFQKFVASLTEKDWHAAQKEYPYLTPSMQAEDLQNLRDTFDAGNRAGGWWVYERLNEIQSQRSLHATTMNPLPATFVGEPQQTSKPSITGQEHISQNNRLRRKLFVSNGDVVGDSDSEDEYFAFGEAGVNSRQLEMDHHEPPSLPGRKSTNPFVIAGQSTGQFNHLFITNGGVIGDYDYDFTLSDADSRQIEPSVPFGHSDNMGQLDGSQQWTWNKSMEGSESLPSSSETALAKPAQQSPQSTTTNIHQSRAGETVSTLLTIFNDPEYYQRLLKCNNADAQFILELCQTLLDTCDLTSDARRQIVTALQRLAAKTKSFPSYFFVYGPILPLNEYAVSSGSFGDIYKATLHEEVLCLKVLRANLSILQKLAKSFAKEAILWSQLSHPNVLPFYGLHIFRSQLSFVSPWAENGSIIEFLNQENVNPDRILLANVLVDRSGRAYLADFGLSNIDDPQIVHWTSQSSVASRGGSARWQAPELHQAESDFDATEESMVIHNTEMSDVFAWGCLCYEIFTGRLPYYHIRLPTAVALKILGGQVPLRPKVEDPAWLEYGLTESIWELMEQCWNFNPKARPNMSAIASWLDGERSVIDMRPAPQWPAGSAMRFRNSESQTLNGHFKHNLDDLDTILSRVTGL